MKNKGIGVASAVVIIIIVAIGAGAYVSLSGGENQTQQEEKAPAEFEMSNLTVSPSEVKPGGTVTVAANISNVGDKKGTYTAELSVNEDVEKTEDITLSGGESDTVSFTIEKNNEGEFNVSLDGLTGSFRVEEENLPSNWDKAISIEELYENPSEYSATSYETFEEWLTDPQQFISNTLLVKGEMEMTGLGEDLVSPLLCEVGGGENIGVGGHNFSMVEDGQNVVLKGLLRFDGESFGMKVEQVYYDSEETREFEIKSVNFDNEGNLELSCYSPTDGVIRLYESEAGEFGVRKEYAMKVIDSGNENVEIYGYELPSFSTDGENFFVTLEHKGIIYYVSKPTFSGVNLEIIDCNLSWNEESLMVSATVEVKNNGDLPYGNFYWIEVYDKEEEDPLFADIGSDLFTETIPPSQIKTLEAKDVGVVTSYDLPLEAEIYLLNSWSPASAFPSDNNILASGSAVLSS